VERRGTSEEKGRGIIDKAILQKESDNNGDGGGGRTSSKNQKKGKMGGIAVERMLRETSKEASERLSMRMNQDSPMKKRRKKLVCFHKGPQELGLTGKIGGSLGRQVTSSDTSQVRRVRGGFNCRSKWREKGNFAREICEMREVQEDAKRGIRLSNTGKELIPNLGKKCADREIGTGGKSWSEELSSNLGVVDLRGKCKQESIIIMVGNC